MKKSIDTQYGKLDYVESFFTGKVDIYLNGKQAIKKKKKEFQIETTNNTNDLNTSLIDIHIFGSFIFGVKAILNGHSYTIYEKAKWYEYLIMILFIILTIIWGNVPTLCKILPIVGGTIGGFVAGFINFLGFALARKTDKSLIKLISIIGSGLLSFFTCFLIAFCILYPGLKGKKC